MLELNLIKDQLNRLRLYNLKSNLESILHTSQIENQSNFEFLKQLLDIEIKHREKRDYERRLKSAHLPAHYNLDNFDHNYGGITKPQLKQLRELIWIENAYNLILMGPSGTGKTFIAAGLVYESIRNGYKAYLITMEELVNTIRMKNISTSAMQKYNRFLNAHLLAIDDIMLFPVKREEANDFFNLINTLHEKASIIVTTNKAPTEWVEILGDEVVTTAILDRILFKCEVLKLSGSSYRIENRKTIFNK